MDVRSLMPLGLDVLGCDRDCFASCEYIVIDKRACQTNQEMCLVPRVSTLICLSSPGSFLLGHLVSNVSSLPVCFKLG